ncbi:hypothetical protein TKK_0014060 [Trichogramma kaykai]
MSYGSLILTSSKEMIDTDFHSIENSNDEQTEQKIENEKSLQEIVEGQTWKENTSVDDSNKKCLKDYFLIANKIIGITADNASANSKFITELSKLIIDIDGDFDVEDQHFRCLAHVLNLGVQDTLKMMETQCDMDNVYPDGTENEFLENHGSESEEKDEDEETNISSTGSK